MNANMAYPVIAMVLLTFIVWLQLFYVRVTEGTRSGLAIEDMTPLNPNVTRRFLTSGDNLRNLFELPVLFYLGASLVLALGITKPILLTLAWIFVSLRYVHSLIHVTYNRILHRFVVYLFSSIVLWAFWFVLALELVDGSVTGVSAVDQGGQIETLAALAPLVGG